VNVGPAWVIASNIGCKSVLKVEAVFAIASETLCKFLSVAAMPNAPSVSVAMSTAVVKSVPAAVARSVVPRNDSIDVFADIPAIAIFCKAPAVSTALNSVAAATFRLPRQCLLTRS
jgi:hypothetical protein